MAKSRIFLWQTQNCHIYGYVSAGLSNQCLPAHYSAVGDRHACCAELHAVAKFSDSECMYGRESVHFEQMCDFVGRLKTTALPTIIN